MIFPMISFIFVQVASFQLQIRKSHEITTNTIQNPYKSIWISHFHGFQWLNRAITAEIPWIPSPNRCRGTCFGQLLLRIRIRRPGQDSGRASQAWRGGWSSAVFFFSVVFSFYLSISLSICIYVLSACPSVCVSIYLENRKFFSISRV